ncbi:MAG: bifunctional UDP-N-acetylmuramoyl-tripeptide:D-alanyl-D-alanine ligase/alanine racemase [Muribaculaceae bacterium]|nr:bifunctional UDP-N-acetylmuramoyl-tripeptide:D-alanyl-D-alanine ligase/alanine racemase [Muribaculaceae bacterium]
MKSELKEIADILGVNIQGNNREIEILLTDSRSLTDPAKSLFFALRGQSNDGHKYIADLYSHGVRAFVVNEIPDTADHMPDACWIVVPDTLKALQTVGSLGRSNASSVIAITGSRGKTTLKEWLFQILSPSLNVSRSPRSYNSQIGVPLSLWGIRPGSDVALIEAGISKVGEMKSISDCISPDTVVITNVGDAHAQGFGSKEEKIKEKVSLAAGNSVKKVIYCADDRDIESEVFGQCFGKELIGWHKSDIPSDLFGEDFAHKDVKDWEIENAGHAITVAKSLGMTEDDIRKSLKRLHRIGTRLNVSEGVNDCLVIHDSYTSDQSSLAPALDFMKRRLAPGSKETLIVSDLIHEADSSDEAIVSMAEMLKVSGVKRLIGVGPRMKKGAEKLASVVEESSFFDTTDELLASLSTSDFCNETILLKGAPQFEFGRIAQLLEARTHETVLEVNLDAVVRNYNYFRSKLPAGTGLVAMVKASGYGAGSYEIAKTLQDCGAAYLAVAVLDEGIDLRRRGITMPVMVMNPKVVNYRQMFANRLEPEIFSMPMLLDVVKEAQKHGVKEYPVHIKLDTGMHRMGFVEEELTEVMRILNSTDAVRIASAFSHLATADCLDMDDYTLLQLQRFDRYTNYMLKESPQPFLRHVLNSAGILRFPEYHYDMARLGIGLYGVNTLPPEVEQPLSVVSTLRTVIIAVRDWKKGESIGYARRSILERDSRIATIPIGYADGMNRHFGRGNITVKVNGKDAPTVGNICMDACMIDVTGIDCKEGDVVEIFGQSASVSRLSDLLDTIPYEILTSVSPRVKRVYYRE